MGYILIFAVLGTMISMSAVGLLIVASGGPVEDLEHNHGNGGESHEKSSKTLKKALKMDGKRLPKASTMVSRTSAPPSRTAL